MPGRSFAVYHPVAPKHAAAQYFSPWSPFHHLSSLPCRIIGKCVQNIEAGDSLSRISECTSRSGELSGPLLPQNPWLPAMTWCTSKPSATSWNNNLYENMTTVAWNTLTGHFIGFSGLLAPVKELNRPPISNQPITLQQFNAFSNAHMIKTTGWSSKQASEWWRKVILSDSECVMVPDGPVWVFQKLVICWDFPTQPSLAFTENGLKRENMWWTAGLWVKMPCRSHRRMVRLLWPNRKATATSTTISYN